jgi:hypothetical protein
MDDGHTAWLDGELSACNLADERLTKRLRKLLGQIGGAMGQSIPFACQDWANAKGAYRFLSNDRVNEADILAGHFQSTRDRAGAAEGLIFVLHDTTEFTFQREDSSAIGITKSVNSGRDKAGRVRSHAVCGILMHSSLALTTEGLQRDGGAEEEGQPDADSNRKEGKHPLVGQPGAIDGASGRSRPVRPYRRSGK